MLTTLPCRQRLPGRIRFIESNSRFSGFVIATIAIFGTAGASVAQTPTAPTGFTITGGTSQLTLTWNNTAGLTYNLYRWSSGSEPTTPTYTGKTSAFTDTGLTNGTQYFYRVSGVNSSNVEGPQSSDAIAAPVAIPASVTAKAGNGVVNLSWGAAAGAMRYNIYRATTSGAETLLASDISAVSYVDTAVTNGTAYYYKVSGVHKDPINIITTESTLSSEVSATPLATLPAAPSKLAAVPGNAQVILSWGAVTGATSYKLYRSLNASGGPYTLLTSPTTTGYTDTTTTNGTTASPHTYYYVVTAVTASGESAYSNEASASPGVTSAAGATLFAVADTTAESANPTLIFGYHSQMYAGNTGSNTNIAYVKFDLSGISGTVTSAILRLDAAATVSGITASASPVSDTTWTEAALNWNNHPSLGATIISQSIPTTETYPTWDVTSYVRSEQLAGHKLVSLALTQDVVNSVGVSIRTRESGIIPQLILVTSGPTAPSSLTATGGLGQVSLSWGGVPGATSYNVKRASVTGGPYTTVATGVTATSYVNTGLADGTAYYYVVSASNSTGEGANSNEASATTNTVTAPRNLTATPGEQQVLLTWNPVAGQGYNVYRSTTSGSGYTKINANGIITPNAYFDTGLTNGTAYYYVVTYVNSAGAESSNSTQASATPLTQDAYWTVTAPSTANIVAPVVTGSSTNNGPYPTEAFSSSMATSLITEAIVTGSATQTTSEAKYSGSWTFTWTGGPSHNVWPSLYVISHQNSQGFVAAINDTSGTETGTATVRYTNGATIVSTTYPTSAQPSINEPFFQTTFNTTDVTNPIISTVTQTAEAGPQAAPGTWSGATTGWSNTLTVNTNTQTAYTQAWFQQHYATMPFTITITVPAIDITTTSSLTNPTSVGRALAHALAFDSFIGR